MAIKNKKDVEQRYTIGDINVVNVQLRLEKRDAGKSYNVRLAEENAKLLQTNLETQLKQGSTSAFATLALHINITRCTPGSRAGRVCCGELGVGWALLFIQWSISEGGDKIVIASGTEKYRSSGALGCDDICESTVGEDFVCKVARSTAPGDIVKNATIALSGKK